MVRLVGGQWGWGPKDMGLEQLRVTTAEPLSGTSREAETSGGLSSQQWVKLQQDTPHGTKDLSSTPMAAPPGLCSRDQKQLLNEGFCHLVPCTAATGAS